MTNSLKEKIEKCLKNKLKKLYLIKYNLNSFPLDVLDLVHLEELYLNHDNAADEKTITLPEDYWWEVSFDNNIINYLPNEINKLQDLKKLYLDQVDLINLPDSFCDLSNLEELSLRNNGLKKLPNDFGKLSNLKSLDLSFNSLESLPESFQNLNQLEELYLTNNNFSKFPKVLYKLKNLKIIKLNNVDGIWNETKDRFNIKKNSINYISQEILNISNILYIVLDNNKIQDIHPGLYKIKNKLSLKGNPIKQGSRFKNIDFIANSNIYNYNVQKEECLNYISDPDNFFKMNLKDEPLYVSFDPRNQALFSKEDIETISNTLKEFLEYFIKNKTINLETIHYKYIDTIYGLSKKSHRYKNCITVYDYFGNFFSILTTDINDIKINELFVETITKNIPLLQNFLKISTKDDLKIESKRVLNKYELPKYLSHNEAFTFQYRIEKYGSIHNLDIFIPFNSFRDKLLYQKTYKNSLIHQKSEEALTDHYSKTKSRIDILSLIYSFKNFSSIEIQNFLDGKLIDITDDILTFPILFNYSSNQIIGYGEIGTIDDIIAILLTKSFDNHDLNELQQNFDIINSNTKIIFDIFPIKQKSLNFLNDKPFILTHRKINFDPFIIQFDNIGNYKAELITKQKDRIFLSRIY